MKGGYMIMAIIDLFFAALVLSVTFFITNTLVNTNIPTGKIETGIAFARITNSPINMQDSAGIALPGMINLTQFTDETINNAYSQKYQGTGARLTLVYDTEQRIIYLNEKTWHTLAPLAASAKIKGPGGGTYEKTVMPVTIVTPDKKIRGTLTAELVASKT